MKRILDLLRKESLVVIVAGLYLWAFIADPSRGLEALASSGRTILSVALIIMSVFSALGLFGVLVDKQAVGRKLGHGSGIRMLLLAAAFGTVLVGPVYAVFPLLKAFREHGARWGVIVAVMTAWAVKVPMIPLEIKFLGWEFSLVRSLLIVLMAVLMGWVFDRLMPRDDVRIPGAAGVAEAVEAA